MTEKSLFVTGVRLFGLWLWYEALSYFLGYTILPESGLEHENTGRQYLAIVCIEIPLGFYLLTGAPGLVSFLFGRTEEQTKA